MMTRRYIAVTVATVAATLTGVTLAAGGEDTRFQERTLAEVPRGIDVAHGIAFSPDGLHVAYVAARGDEFVPVIDAKAFDAQSYVHGARWSADGRVAFAVVRPAEKRVQVSWLLLDGKRAPGTEGVDLPEWSPDGRRLAFVADPECKIDADRSRPGPFHLFIDGKKGAKWRGVAQLTWSRDSAQLLAVAEGERGKYCVLLDGKPLAQGARYDGPAFSPDGSRVAYGCELVKRGALASDWTAIKWYVACGSDRLGLEFDNAGSPVFSPDGRHIAFKAERAGRVGISVDGKEPLGSWSFVSAPAFSPDGAHMAFAASSDCNVAPGYRVTTLPGAGLVTGGTWQVVMDGTALEAKFDAVDALTYSPDSKRLAFRTRRAKRWRMHCDARESEEYDFVGPPVFSQDGKRIGFGALRGREFAWKVMVVE